MPTAGQAGPAPAPADNESAKVSGTFTAPKWLIGLLASVLLGGGGAAVRGRGAVGCWQPRRAQSAAGGADCRVGVRCCVHPARPA